jgi:hypothetical protein
MRSVALDSSVACGVMHQAHRACSVSKVCGRVINSVGEQLIGVELILTREADSVDFTVKSDAKGKFSFRSISKGDYTLHATATGYQTANREIRVTRSRNYKRCAEKLDVQLGVGSCDTGVRVKGTDK